MFHLPQIMTDAEVKELRELGARAPWVEGRVTASGAAAQQKRNQQVDELTDVGRAIGAQVMRALQRNVVFAAAAIPFRVRREAAVTGVVANDEQHRDRNARSDSPSPRHPCVRRGAREPGGSRI